MFADAATGAGPDSVIALAGAAVSFLQDAGVLGMLVLAGILLWKKAIVLGWTYQDAVAANKELREENRALRDLLGKAASAGARAARVADVTVRQHVARVAANGAEEGM